MHPWCVCGDVSNSLIYLFIQMSHCIPSNIHITWIQYFSYTVAKTESNVTELKNSNALKEFNSIELNLFVNQR